MTDTDIDIDDTPLPEEWQWEDEGLISSKWLCDHTWLEIRLNDDEDDTYWWSELWLTPDKCESETHNEGYDIWASTYAEVMYSIGDLDALDVKEFCHYCSGSWPLPKDAS